MKCPTCKDTNLISDWLGIEIEYCPQCRGMWLGRGEPDKILERSTASEPRPSQGGPEFQERLNSHGKDGHRCKKKNDKSLLSKMYDL